MVDLSSLNPFRPTIKATTEISDLRIYPIKSCRGISLKSTVLTRKGLDLDRNWMFINTSTNKFVTIRDIPELTLVNTALSTSVPGGPDDAKEDLELIISIRNKPESRVQIPARPTTEWLKENTELGPVTIWKDDTDAWIYPDEINKVFADFLQQPVALVYKGPAPRATKGNAAPQDIGRQEYVNFPDALPVLIGNEQSLAELNTRLVAKGEQEITIERFRPNIILKGGEPGAGPWDEDKWKVVRAVDKSTQSTSFFQFGPSALDIDVVCHCARCQVPNVNPDTGEKNKHEPW